MTSIESAAQPYAPVASAQSRLVARPRLLLGLAIVVAALFGQLTALGKFHAVWTSGAFFDTDDAMRAVQVRDLAAGQSWFDMTQYRLDPPVGVFMHWSRVVDVPLLFLIKSFAFVVDPATAERLARLAFPLLLTLAFFALAVRLCETLLGRAARWPALAAAFLYGPATGQFQPGRIDHHAPQIVLLVLATTALCHALINARARWAALAGAAVALSMAISVENVPFFAMFFGALVLLWVLDGRAIGTVLAHFSVGLALALPVVYAATIAPSRYLIIASDALSLAQGFAMLVGAAYAASLAVLTTRLPDTRLARAIVAVAGGLATAAFVAGSFPVLAENPFAHLDPLVKRFWLDGVQEALPLATKFRDDPLWTLGVSVPALLGLLGAAYAAQTTQGARRQAWLVIAITMIGGLAAGMLMVRTLSAVLALGVPGALAVALRLRDTLAMRAPSFRGPFATCVLILGTSSVGWATVCDRLRAIDIRHQADEIGAAKTPRSNVADFGSCTAPDAFASLAGLPPGRVLAEPDLGGYILAHTPHSIVAGAYHRNEIGLRRAIEAFIAPFDNATTAVARTGADYVVYCRSAADPQFVEVAPYGLAARLANGDVPEGLRHLAAHRDILDVYRVEDSHAPQK